MTQLLKCNLMKCVKVNPCNKNKDEKPKHELIIGIQVDYDDMRFDFNILWLLGLCTVASLFLISFAIKSFDQQDTFYFKYLGNKEFWLHYGVKSTFCVERFQYLPGMWPSFLREVEHQYKVNMSYRAAVLIPMPFRIYIAFIMVTLLFKDKWNNKILWKGYCLGNNLISLTAIVEILSQAVFSVNSLRFDNPMLHRNAFLIFAISSTVFMWFRTIFNLQIFKEKILKFDILSFLIKAICATIYTTHISTFYDTHSKFMQQPTCHPYVHKEDAITEYLVILSYLFYHLTILIDVRNVRLVCYPTSSSQKREIILAKNCGIVENDDGDDVGITKIKPELEDEKEMDRRQA